MVRYWVMSALCPNCWCVVVGGLYETETGVVHCGCYYNSDGFDCRPTYSLTECPGPPPLGFDEDWGVE